MYEKRYYDKVIIDKEGMLEVSRYIHLNPVEARMVQQPEYYPWSSYYLFKNPSSVPPRFMNMDCLLDYYEGTVEQRREKYCGACHHPYFVELIDIIRGVTGTVLNVNTNSLSRFLQSFIKDLCEKKRKNGTH